MKIVDLPLADLKPYKNNPRDNDKAVDAVAASINEFGFKIPIIIDSDNIIIAGHTRLKAAQKLGLKTAPCIRADDLTEEQAKAFRLADNKTAELAEWDFSKLEEELAELTDIDMTAFGFDLTDDVEPIAVTEDEVPETAETRCKTGDIWKLGNHRLICGDSTDSAVIDRLMDGEKADIAITSPPYGVQGNAKLRDHYVKGQETTKSLYDNYSDDSGSWGDLIEGAFYQMQRATSAQFINIQMLANNKTDFVAFWNNHIDKFVDVIIWDKSRAAPQMQSNVLNNRFEFILVFCDNNSRSIPFADFHGNISNIIEISPTRNEFADIHKAVYPVELPSQIMTIAQGASSVLDIFGGTGTTMIACEQMGRKCYMSEMNSKYCDIIIQRWENLTGQTAELISE